jgi:hypothetical protein
MAERPQAAGLSIIENGALFQMHAGRDQLAHPEQRRPQDPMRLLDERAVLQVLRKDEAPLRQLMRRPEIPPIAMKPPQPRQH